MALNIYVIAIFNDSTWNEMRRKANATSLDPSDIPIYCNQCKMKCKADALDSTHQGHKVRLNKGTTK